MRYTQDDYLNLPDEVLVEAYSKVYAGRIHKHSKSFLEAVKFLRSRISKLDLLDVDWWDRFIRELDIAIFFDKNPNYKFPSGATNLSDDVMAAAYDVLLPDRKDTLKATKVDNIKTIVCYDNLRAIRYKDTVLDFIDYVEKQVYVVRPGIATKLSLSAESKQESVSHPPHYGGEDNPHEAIKVIEAWQLGFNLGNVVKYLSRAGKKGDALEDLKKAKWYLEREIKNLEK